MERVCVTGALGFIGFHLCNRLLNEGIEVIAVDHLQNDRTLEEEEMELRMGRNAHYHLHKLTLDSLHTINDFNKIDAIFHIAANDQQLLKETAESELAMLEKLIKKLPANTRLIYASSTEVYGDQEGEISESAPLRPDTLLGKHKQKMEKSIAQLSMEQSVVSSIVRMPVVYGPWQQEYVEKVDYSKAIYISDAVNGLMLSAMKKKGNEVFHLPSFFDIDCSEKRPQSLEGSFLSTSKSENLLGYKPQVRVKEGLAKYNEHVKQWQKQCEFQKGSG
jgi:UDP-glucose 4-epimerase